MTTAATLRLRLTSRLPVRRRRSPAFEADCTNVISVNAGNYSVTEPAVTGYATTYANSLRTRHARTAPSLAVALGESATCTDHQQ